MFNVYIIPKQKKRINTVLNLIKTMYTIRIMGKFGKTLKNYRERHNITKLALAKGIGTSDAYIRQIENQNYKPPTFEVCEKISTFLSLSTNEKLNLYEAAFLERIESEKNFYEILKNTVFIKNKPVFEETISSYTIKWHLRKMVQNKLLEIKLPIIEIIKQLANKSGIQVLGITIFDNFIELQLEDANTEKIQAAMPNLMKLASGKIKSDFPGFSSVPNIWKSHFEISKEPSLAQESKTNRPLITTKV